MEKAAFNKEKILGNINFVLFLIAGALVLILLIGTIIGVARSGNPRPLLTFGGSDNTVQAAPRADDIRVFSGLGRLRIQLANSSILILSIAFPYPASDIAFTEELAGKISDLRTIATDYFSALPAENLIQIDEETAKQEILRRYNAVLRLGRIDALYFSDMMVIDAGL